MKRVIVLSTGGTIASRFSPRDRGLVSVVCAEDLVKKIGVLDADLEVVTEQFSNVMSYCIDLDTAFRMAMRIDTLLKDLRVAGVVVTHGTDTMEESAYLSDLVVGSEKPVVFTGAQRQADDPASDGPYNLADAIRVAGSPEAMGLGTPIVFEKTIHAARDATKNHSSRVGTFASAEHGQLGEIDEGKVIFQRHTIRRETVKATRIEPRVDVIKMVMGSDDRFVRFAAESGAQALILEAFGRGNAPPVVAKAVADVVRRGIPVAVTSRAPSGRVAPIYAGGGGADLAAAGALFSGDLSSVKSRVLVALLLGAGAGPSKIQQALEQHGY
jgi:L-asparaginase